MGPAARLRVRPGVHGGVAGSRDARSLLPGGAAIRIVFVFTGLENHGVGALSAILSARGHRVSFVYEPRLFSTDSGLPRLGLSQWLEPSVGETARRVLDARPDLVAFSSCTLTHAWAVAVARQVRRQRIVPTVFGGSHPTGAPGPTVREPAIDAVVVGEGESAMLALAECVDGTRFARTDIPGTWVLRDDTPFANPPGPLAHDLDALPFVDRAAFYGRVPAFERDFMVLTQRGCPFRCAYCEHSTFASRHPGEPRVRRRSPAHVLEELRIWKARGRMRKVFFWDTIFAMDASWLSDFLPRYRAGIGLPFECYGHPRTVTPEIARLLAEGGCRLIRLGVQSVNAATLDRLGRPAGPAQVRQAVAWLREAGVPFAFDHILGLPGEGVAEQRAAVREYARLRPSRILAHWMTYFPGTVAFDDAVRNGLLSADEVDGILAGVGPGFDGPHGHGDVAASVGETERLQVLMELIPLLPESVITRLLDTGLYRRIGGGARVRQVVAAWMLFSRNSALRQRMRLFLELLPGESTRRLRDLAGRALGRESV